MRAKVNVVVAYNHLLNVSRQFSLKVDKLKDVLAASQQNIKICVARQIIRILDPE